MLGIQFVFGKITPARSKIGACVTQHIDQLKPHSVTLSQNKHFIFGPACKLANVSEAKPRPKFTDATGHEVGVFVEIRSSVQGADLMRITKTLQIEHLAARNFFECIANVAAVRVLHSLKFSQVIG